MKMFMWIYRTGKLPSSYLAKSSPQEPIYLNCTPKNEFLEQAALLRSRFVDKGYNSEDLDGTIVEVSNMDRATILYGTGKPKKDEKSG